MSSIAPHCHTRREGAASDDWITPKHLIERLGPFDLDPCASLGQPWPCAAVQYTVHDDGLARPWWGLVYMNPPYGKALGDWLKRLAQHGHGVALVFGRTETKAFFDWVWPFASAVLFLKGRLTFCLPGGVGVAAKHNSGGPSVLVAYGGEAVRRLKECGDLGAIVMTEKGLRST